MAWESVSGGLLVDSPVDAHLLRRVLKPSGVGELGPFYVARLGGRAA